MAEYASATVNISVRIGSGAGGNWVGVHIANQSVNICIDNSTGCLNNPGVGSAGYFIGIYNIPSQYQTYIEHELPGSGAVGTQDISYVAPIPSSPPVANAQNANYANTAGYANSSGLPAWSQEANSYVGQPWSRYWWYNTTGNTLLVSYDECSSGTGITLVPPGGRMPISTYYINFGRGWCEGTDPIILSAYSG